MPERPELLTDPQLFPLEINTRSYWFNAETATLSSEYVGVVGKGRVEVVAKNIHLLEPSAKIGDRIFNELSSTKQMFGYVTTQDYSGHMTWGFCDESAASIFAGNMLRN
ncbi:MAG: hypothetical protein LBP35_02570 [Candidatus Ancillula trichonymphae]|nr:hypothetical protein [Candidatus Ancillula trichonymphae]